jgi:hypothetical protein
MKGTLSFLSPSEAVYANDTGEAFVALRYIPEMLDGQPARGRGVRRAARDVDRARDCDF